MRGKRLSEEMIYRVMTSYAITGNKAETARLLNLSASTVKNIIRKNEKRPELVEVSRIKKQSFIEATDEIVDDLILRIKERVKVNDPNVTLSQLTTALGTIYDKRALAKGESTENTSVTIKLPPGMDEYAE